MPTQKTQRSLWFVFFLVFLFLLPYLTYASVYERYLPDAEKLLNKDFPTPIGVSFLSNQKINVMIEETGETLSIEIRQGKLVHFSKELVENPTIYVCLKNEETVEKIFAPGVNVFELLQTGEVKYTFQNFFYRLRNFFITIFKPELKSQGICRIV